jgi:Indoleamine 2,3-dioxygenase
MRGTGGTALIPFLKEVRDETGEPVIGVGTEVAHKRKENGDAS